MGGLVDGWGAASGGSDALMVGLATKCLLRRQAGSHPPSQKATARQGATLSTGGGGVKVKSKHLRSAIRLRQGSGGQVGTKIEDEDEED
jgi:hypothetical protein